MIKQKVRPMVDKELRDEVVSYLCGSASFNQALGWYIKGHKQLIAKNKGQSELITILKGQIADLEANERNSSAGINNQLMFTKMELQGAKSHAVSLAVKNQALKNQLKRGDEELNELKRANAELSTKLDGTDKAYKFLFELYVERKGRWFIKSFLGMVCSLITGLAIGYLFL